MATRKGQTIAEYAVSKIGCAYIYGGYGEKKCSPSFRKERAGAYPEYKAKMYQYCPVLSGKQSSCAGCKYDGKQAYDCAQLTRYSCKAAGQALVSGANSQWTKTAWEQKGTIDSLPDVPGVILYHMNDAGRMTHTGVYIGGGYAVEARGHAYGVVKTKVSSRSWTHWAALPGVLDGTETAPGAPAEKVEQEPTLETGGVTAGESGGNPGTQSGEEVYTMKTLRTGSKGTQVEVLQWRLNRLGYNAGTVDGIFGAKTKAAVLSFQKAKSLEEDGVAGKNTWAALMK